MQKYGVHLHFLTEGFVMPELRLGEAVVIHRHDLTPVRERFMHDRDVYPRWAVLAPVAGRLAYTLESENGATSSSGVCSSGSLIICPPYVTLHRELLEPSRFWFAEFDLTLPGQTPWWPSGEVRVADRRRLRTNFRILEDSEGLRDPRRLQVRTHVLVDVLVLVGWENEPVARPIDPAAARGATLLERMVTDPDASIESISETVNLSRTQFTRRFREAYGVPPIRYLTELRLAKAQRLLLDTDESVTAIAAWCGYHSPFYFARVFRQSTGQTPTTYRRTRRI